MPEIVKKQRGRPKGSQNRATKEIREKLAWAFHKAAGEHGEGLADLAVTHPAVFYGLIARIVPQEANLTVTHAIINLGDAMLDAQTRLANMQPAHNEHHATVIDAQPDAEIAQPIDNKGETDLT